MSSISGIEGLKPTIEIIKHTKNIAIATGTLDKKMYVYDSTDGKILYSKKLPYIGSAPPSTYLFENDQYIVIHASGGTSLKKGYPDLVETGNVIIAFKLKNKLN